MTSESVEAAGPPAQHPDEPHGGSVEQPAQLVRAGVLGANDGIVSTAGIVVGVAGRPTTGTPSSSPGSPGSSPVR